MRFNRLLSPLFWPATPIVALVRGEGWGAIKELLPIYGWVLKLERGIPALLLFKGALLDDAVADAAQRKRNLRSNDLGRNERGNQFFHEYVDWYLANDPKRLFDDDGIALGADGDAVAADVDDARVEVRVVGEDPGLASGEADRRGAEPDEHEAAEGVEAPEREISYVLDMRYYRQGYELPIDVEASELDGRPALVLRYERNGWPVSTLRDELRTVRPGMALGPFYVQAGGRYHLIGWMGLQAA